MSGTSYIKNNKALRSLYQGGRKAVFVLKKLLCYLPQT